MRKILLILVICAATSCRPTTTEPPVFRFDSVVFDFGTNTEGELIAGKFTFQNAGKGVLKVGTPDPACGCTVASVKPNTLKPGEKGELAFTLDLTNARGPIEKHITVPSNDPANTNAVLTIKGHSKAVFGCSPEMVFFEDLPPGQTGQEEVEIERVDGNPLLIGKAEVSEDFLKVTVKPEEDSQGRRARITIEATGTGKPGQFSDLLSVYMKDASAAALLVPIAGQFLPYIEVDPDKLIWTVPNPKDWPGPDPDSSTTRKIIVSITREDRTFDLGDFTSTLEDLMVKVDELERGKKFAVTLKLPKPLQTSMQGVVTFQTTIPEQPAIEIPVVIGVLKP
jgi:uncharacterized protein DUF1573